MVYSYNITLGIVSWTTNFHSLVHAYIVDKNLRFFVVSALHLLIYFYTSKIITLMILSFRTDRPGQTVQTQIRLLLEEQSDQGLHCLPFRLHGLDSLVYGKGT